MERLNIALETLPAFIGALLTHHFRASTSVKMLTREGKIKLLTVGVEEATHKCTQAKYVLTAIVQKLTFN